MGILARGERNLLDLEKMFLNNLKHKQVGIMGEKIEGESTPIKLSMISWRREMKIIFIAHGAVQVGMGHIMRSLALADEFRWHGHNVSFLSKYDLGIETIKKWSFCVTQIPVEPIYSTNKFMYREEKELTKEIQFLKSWVREIIDVIIVDSYNVTEQYFYALHKFAKYVAYIDDLNTFAYPVNIIINGSICASKLKYRRNFDQLYLLGLQYVILRKEFTEIGFHEVSEEVQNILVTTGGSDPYHMTEKILKSMSKLQWVNDVTVHVIIGAGFEKEVLTEITRIPISKIICYETPDSMVGIMMKCDIAIAAGGSTIYELAACGVPSLVFTYANNQEFQVKELDENGLIVPIGGYDNFNGNELSVRLELLRENYKLRKRMAQNLRKLVNGKGAENIVNAINRYVCK